MKASTFVLFGAGLWQAVSAGTIQTRSSRLSKRDVDPIAMCAGPGGRVADPPGAAPRRQEIKAADITPGARRVKLRHGPYVAPGMTQKSIMGERGMLWNCGDDQIEKPCEECTVVRIEAGFEYPNGTNANIDTGMWMHHMVAFLAGPSRWDPTCYRDNFSLPHLVVGQTPQNSERWFASGNERTVVDFTRFDVQGKKSGYHLVPEDKFSFIVDLMNMNMDDRTMYLTMTYDVIDGKLPANYVELKNVWLDADQCALSEIAIDGSKTKFAVASDPWIPNFEGEVVITGGHLHDGGTSASVYSSENNMICDSVAQYGTKPEFIFTPKMEMDKGIAIKHISDMTLCDTSKIKGLKLDPKQRWVLKGNYDLDKHAPNLEDGQHQDVMAIALMYVAVKPGLQKPA